MQVFGACGTRKCEGPSCWQMAGRKYKFYLSLENSICKVTPDPEFVNVEGALASLCSLAGRYTSKRAVVPARQAGNRYLSSLKGLQIRAQKQS
jgi:hypothetical protein